MFIDATMFIFFNDDFSLTNNVYIFNDGFSLTTTVGLAVCLAAIISLQTQSLSQSALGSIVWIRSFYFIDGFLLGYFLGNQTTSNILEVNFFNHEGERYLQFLEIENTNSFANRVNYFELVSGILEVWYSSPKNSSKYLQYQYMEMTFKIHRKSHGIQVLGRQVCSCSLVGWLWEFSSEILG